MSFSKYENKNNLPKTQKGYKNIATPEYNFTERLKKAYLRLSERDMVRHPFVTNKILNATPNAYIAFVNLLIYSHSDEI